MEQTNALTIGFKGAIDQNGVPMFNHDGAPLTVGGYIDDTNTEKAYFGRVVSEDPSTLHSFLMGCASGDNVVGVLQNDYAINEHSPVKPDYILNKFPATAIVYGPFWMMSWTHVGANTLTTPTRSSVVIFKNTTGQIEFLPVLTAIPVGYSILNAKLIEYNADTNRALLFMGAANSDQAGSTPDVLENTTLQFLNTGAAIPGVVFTGTFNRAIDFEDALASTNTDGSLISTGTSWIVHATAGQCAIKALTSSTAALGDYAALRMRARSDGAFVTGTRGNVMGGDFSASANVNDFQDLRGVQGVAQTNDKTQADASAILNGVYARVDNGASNAGRSWSLWVDTHETVKAAAGHYLARLSHNGGAITLDGFFTLYAGQGCTNLFTFENTNAPIGAAVVAATGSDASIQVMVGSTPYFIPLYNSLSA